MTNEVVIVSSPTDWTAVFSAVSAFAAVVIAVYSFLHSKKISREAAADNKEAARLNRISTRTGLHTMLEQKKLVKHQIEHDKRLVMPDVCGHICNIKDGLEPFCGIKACNFGLGPAMLGPALLVVDDKPICLMLKQNDDLVFTTLKGLGAHSSIGLSYQGSNETFSLPVGEERQLIWADLNKDKSGWLYENKQYGLIIPYTSIFRDKVSFLKVRTSCSEKEYPVETLRTVFLDAKN